MDTREEERHRERQMIGNHLGDVILICMHEVIDKRGKDRYLTLFLH